MKGRFSLISLSLAVLLSWGHVRDAAPAAVSRGSGSGKATAQAFSPSASSSLVPMQGPVIARTPSARERRTQAGRAVGAPEAPARLARVAPSTGAMFDEGVASPGDYIVAEYFARQLSRVTPAGVRTAIYTFASGTGDERPMRVAIDGSGNYIVTSEDSNNSRRLSLVTPDGVRTLVYGWGSIEGAVGVAVDDAGDYIVAELGLTVQALAKITPAGARSVIYDYTGIHGLLISPRAVAIDGSGNYIVIEDHALESATLSRITPGGVRTVVYTFTRGVWDGDLAVDQAGDYIVTDSVYGTLHRITPAGVQTVIASFGEEDAPCSVVVDSSGNYVVTQTYKQRLSLVTPGGAVSTIYDYTSSAGPSGIAIVPGGETTYSATIWGWDYIEGWQAIPITEDGSATGFSTPHTFTGLTGSHTFTVPSTDSLGHPFSDWDTGWTDRTITVSEAGTYTARYRAGYSVTIWSWCAVEGWLASPITMDGVATGYTTPHTFSDLTGTHTFTAPSSHADGHPFHEWSTGSTDPTLTVSEAGTYTARYHLASVLPDLVESAVSEPPTAGSPGMVFEVTDTAANQGTAVAGLSTTRYFLSLDQVRSRFDPAVANRSVPELAISATSAGGVSATIPANIALGTYYLLACADALGAVTELVETNNCRASTHTIVIASGGLPDLIENWVGNPPPGAKAGSTIEVTDQAGNQGNAAAGASTTRYYLSLDTIKGLGDPQLAGARAVPALPVGTAAGDTVAVTIPVSTAPGTYYLIACADDLGVVTESNETNNCLSSAGTATVQPASKAFFDFTGDSKSDILWRHATQGDVWLWPMDGPARTAETHVRTVADSNWEIRGLGDQDGDGKADLLWRNKVTGQIYFWPMDGSTPVDEIYVATVDPAYDIVGTGDYDGDGMSDILWRHMTTGAVWIWLMNGATKVSEVYVDTVDPGYVVKGSGDLNGDTKADIVWHHATTGDVWVWLMNGTTRTSQTYVGTVPDVGYQIVGVADHTGDGKADILWRHATRGEVWIWPMNGTTVVSETNVDSVPDTGYQIVGTGDYNGDTKADILWHHATRGEVWVWLMNGTTKVSQTLVGTVPDVGYEIVKVK